MGLLQGSCLRGANYSFGNIHPRRISQSSLAFCLISVFSILLLPIVSYAAQITLSWNPATDANVAGYKVYYGASSQSKNFQTDAGKNTKITIPNLQIGATYYFVVTTYDSSGQETKYSDEIPIPNLQDGATHFLAVVPLGSGGQQRNYSKEIYSNATSACQWSISPSSQSFGSSGGGGSVTISTKLACPWTAVGNVSWVIVTSNSSGTGNGAVYYLVSPNVTVSSREGTLDVAGQTFKISQSGLMQYTLNITKSGTGTGTITSAPAGTTFETGTDVTLKAAPDANSIFTGWFGRCLGASPTCGFTMNANTSVNATFKLKTYIITVRAGTHGSVSPSGPVRVDHGGSQSFRFVPNKGYQIARIRVDGVSVGRPNTLLLGNVMAPHRIDAAFALLQKGPKQ